MYAVGLALGTLRAIAGTLTNVVIPLVAHAGASPTTNIGLLYPLIFLGLLTYSRYRARWSPVGEAGTCAQTLWPVV